MSFNLTRLLLLLRFAIKFFSGNNNSQFVQLVYNLTEPMVSVFGNVFPVKVVEEQYIFETNTLLALIVFSVIGHLFFEFYDKIAYSQQKHKQSKKPTVTDLQYKNQAE